MSFLACVAPLLQVLTPSAVKTLPIFLVDNGSRRAASTLALRGAAAQLQTLLGRQVEPVSLGFSHEVPAADLEGVQARTLQQAVLTLAARRDAPIAIVVPLFLGPSRSLTKAVAECHDELLREGLPLELAVAGCLVDERLPEDDRVARALAALVLQIKESERLQPPIKVALVDHGTPSRAVNAVRVRLVEELRTILEPQLGEGALVVSGSSMERREGSEYDFNEPLLERLVGAAPPFDTGDVVVAMAFCLPGRHAGPGGDVAEILEAARVGEPGLRTFTTPLLAAQPLVLELLRDRALAAEQEVLQSEASVPAPHALM